ncbi:MAG: VCBS repeat-containing protein [Bryobacteraceae bacterium]
MASFSTRADAATPVQPTFFDRYDYTGCAGDAGSITAGDINGDGIPDVVCSYYNGVGTLFGNGDGTFRPGPTSNVGPFTPNALVLVDLNGDGKLDLISFGTPNGLKPFGFYVSFGNGDGTFQPGTFYGAGPSDYEALYIVTGDFNGDGILDFASLTNSGVWLYTGQGGGVFNPGTLIPVTDPDGNYQIAASDLNRDGKLDLVLSNNAGLSVLLGNGNGTFQAPTVVQVPYDSVAFTLGDFNGDGKVDLFASSYYSNNGYLFLGNGDGTFQRTRKVNLNSTTPTVVAADINGDGFLDIVTSAGYVLFGNGKGNFASPVYYQTESGGNNHYVLAADLHLKNVPDLVFANFYPGISVLLNNGKGKFEEGVTVPISGGGAYCAVTGDFNGDGIPDLAVTVAQGLSILLGTGKTSSAYTQGQLITYSQYSCPVLGDLNGDGILDLFVTTGDNQAVGYLGNGDGTFRQAATTTALSSNGIPVLGDFNGDGKLDFALTSNLLAYGNGDGTFQTPAPYIPHVKGNNIVGIAAGRLRRKETSDIVLTDFVSNIVYVLLSTGSGFIESTFGAVSNCSNPINPVLADINQDGFKDLVIGCAGAYVPIYTNNGEGVFTYATSLEYVQVADAAFPLVADVNGDGIPDVVIQGNEDLGILIGEGNLTFSTPTYIGFGSEPGHVIAVDAHGQSPYSGKPDLITPDATGVMNIFFNTTE